MSIFGALRQRLHYHPAILRLRTSIARRKTYRAGILAVALLGSAVLGTMLVVLTQAEAPDSSRAETQEWEILTLINNERRLAGAQPLRMQTNIRDYARIHAKDMRTQGSIWHDMPAYTQWLPDGWRSSAENVAYSSSVARIHQALMDSSGHRTNILNPSYNYIGIGVAHSASGSTMYLSENFLEHSGQVAVVNPPPPADTTRPAVSMTSPLAGFSATIGSTVSLAANATDNIGVTRVEFYNGSTLLGSDVSSPYSFAWNTAGQAAGTKPLTAKAYDGAGNSTISSTISMTLTAAPVNPGTGDANNDGRVNGLDYSILSARYGQNYMAADFNNDGTVSAADLAIMLNRWTW